MYRNKSLLASFSLSLIILISNHIYSQRTCAAADIFESRINSNPQYSNTVNQIESFTQQYVNSNNVGRSIVTIPTVVHVVYPSNSYNISDVQIYSQIQVLNEDFRRLNTDADNSWGQAADIEIEFCLASVDPSGNPTSGITRTPTSVGSFSTNDAVKYSQYGGKNAWPTDQYLNIWVCPLSGGLLGYAQFPGAGAASTDGVVINSFNFGRLGSVSYPFDKGRTTTHEVGHWLNLRHIWGDGGCGASDFVSDTPDASGPSSGCPSGKATCGSFDMYQNYMDYSNDACMNLFTQGQKSRMRALFAPGGYRASLLNSNGCNGGVASTNNAAGTCFDPILISCGDIYSDNTSRGTSKVSQYACQSWNESGKELIHEFTINQLSEVQISLSNLSADLDLFLLSSCDQSSCVGFGDNNIVMDSLQAGTYLIVVDGYNGAVGSYDLTLDCVPLVEVQQDGTCGAPFIIECGNSYQGSTVGASNSNSLYSCIGWNESGKEVYHQFTIDNTTNVKFTLSNLGADIDLFIVNSCDPNSCMAHGDNSIVVNQMQPGQYILVADGYNGAEGAYTLAFECSSQTFAGSSQNKEGNTAFIKENESGDFELYPNPFSQVFTVDFEKMNVDVEKIEVIDMSGKLVFSENVLNNQKLVLDMSGHEDGVYMMLVKTQNMVLTKRVIKSN